MIPVSHIGKSNYEQLGNQRVGETHQSRMARVNAASANQPTLVGNPAIPQVIQGSKPWAQHIRVFLEILLLTDC